MFRKILSSSSLLMLLLAALLWWPTADQTALAGAWESKVDPALLQEMNLRGDSAEVEFIIELTAQAEIGDTSHLGSKEAKGQYVFEQLTAVANASQGPLLAQLQAQNLPHRAYWVTNAIWVRGEFALLPQLAQRDDVAYLHANPTVSLPELPSVEEQVEQTLELLAIEWGVQKINAPSVWAEGFTGQGVVIGGQDTGYDWDHPALIGKYRGWNGSTADHNYNWHDAIHSGSGGVCGLNSPVPCDDHGHGTHTMGTMAGDDGGTNQIGVAPGAKWVGCRNMDVGNGTPTTYIECFQWFLAPTDLTDSNPMPSLAPHVINNSWGCPTSEGCNTGNFAVMQAVVENLRSAGIMVVVSAGNEGSSCSTVETPAAIFDASYTVGATSNTANDTIASFSSRGQVTVDGSNRMKPDISAPGVGVRSSTPGGGYGSSSGTSMASPHVAGAVALLISAEPSLAGNVDALEALLNGSAVPRTTSQGCGGDSPTAVPNNVYGHGRLDVFAAYQLMAHSLAIHKEGPAAVYASEPITYTLTITHENEVTATHNVILTDTLPVGSSLVTATLPFTLTGNVVSWHWASLAANASASVELVVEVATPQTISNSDYGVQSDEAPFATGAAVETVVMAAEHTLAVGKTGPEEVLTGQPITYTLTISHAHPLGEPTTNVVLTDTLPAGTSFVTATLPYTLTGDVVTWHWPTLADGGYEMVQLVVSSAVSQTVVNSDYGVQSDEVGLVTGAAVQTVVTDWPTPASFQISKTAPAQVLSGEPITYTLTITYLYPTGDPTSNVWLTDTLPAGTTFITATMPYSMAGDVVSWYWPSMAAGDSATVQWVVQAAVTQTTTITNAWYGVWSDEVAFVAGTAVATQVEPIPAVVYPIYLPFVLKP
ncbi:MAG: S8 family serine peptidase [Chloroflexi bacterium]|nr:S8 family serine peptidase [Chloroflexota bacterium]